MGKAKITFSNNETLIVSEGELFVPIVKVQLEKEIASSMSKTFEVWNHPHDGLTPALTELFYNCEYFFHIDDNKTAYSTSAIVKIENL